MAELIPYLLMTLVALTIVLFVQMVRAYRRDGATGWGAQPAASIPSGLALEDGVLSAARVVSPGRERVKPGAGMRPPVPADESADPQRAMTDYFAEFFQPDADPVAPVPTATVAPKAVPAAAPAYQGPERRRSSRDEPAFAPHFLDALLSTARHAG